MGFYVKTFLGAGLFLASVAAFNYALIELLQVGTCASGNTPYEISRPCPSGVGADIGLLVGSIFAGMLGAGIFAFRGNRPGHQTSLRNTFSWGTFAWGFFFAATGVACIVAVMTNADIESSGGGKLGGWIVGVTFVIMGVPALIFALWGLIGDREKRADREKPSMSRLTPSFLGGGGGGDALDKIDRLNKLRESGALTQAEFEKEKAKLLAE